MSDEHTHQHEHLAAIERAMVGIRRSQRRRSLARRVLVADGESSVADSAALFDVIDVIDAAEESAAPIGVSAITVALSIAQPRASKLVAEAVQAGLVRREADQADGRRALLVLTDAGRALCDEVHRTRRHAFAAAMADWSNRDRATFARLLTRFLAAYSAYPADHPIRTKRSIATAGR